MIIIFTTVTLFKKSRVYAILFAMEKVTRITNKLNEQIVIDKYLLFEWKLTKQEEQGRKIVLEFERDDSVPYIEELRKLENSYYEYHIGPMFLSIIFPIIAFIFLTIFLVLMIIQRGNFKTEIYFPSLMIPAFVFLLLGVLITFLRSKAINKIDVDKPIKEVEMREKIKQIKSKN